jgi:tetratricopeptide (TPR) repeat protein
MPEKKTCFVIMGFGKKTDYQTGRVLDLDASYRSLIKPAVEEAGLECIRADEIVHSGVIDVPMYQQIFTADVVVADLSTANSNAFYELGVRHAMRPFTTIIIAEDQFVYPFDVNHTAIRKYKHLGEDIGYTEVMRFRALLKDAIQKIADKPDPDSPVYTYLNGLNPPGFIKALENKQAKQPEPAAAAAPQNDPTLSVLMEQAAAAKKRKDFGAALRLLGVIRDMMRPKTPEGETDVITPHEDPYIIQQIALLTYKGAEHDADKVREKTPPQSPAEEEAVRAKLRAAYEESAALLETLSPHTSNDTETLGLWGAVHKRLWDLTSSASPDEAEGHLNEAVRSYERGFHLRNDYYNGINLAFMLNVRAARNAESAPAEAVADYVQARRVRAEVKSICEEWLKANKQPDADEGGEKAVAQYLRNKYWVIASKAEALLGMGETAAAEAAYAEAYALADEDWMIDSTKGQRKKLEPLLDESRSPLRYVRVG